MRFTSLLVMGTTLAVPSYSLAAPEGDLAADLAKVSRLRIFFGHQSVGGNILDGVAQLSREVPQAKLEVVEGSSPQVLSKPAFLQAAIGQNAQPQTKIAQFRQVMEGGLGNLAQVAFYKFCYLDIGVDTDVEALFAQYRRSHEELKGKFPGTTFVHVTAPLTVVEGGAKGALKRLLGKTVKSAAANAKRHRFNELMRQAYQGKEPLFDLARIEATSEDGQTFSVTHEGKALPALISAYTDDGSHLNARGGRWVARHLIAFLASLPSSGR